MLAEQGKVTALQQKIAQTELARDAFEAQLQTATKEVNKLKADLATLQQKHTQLEGDHRTLDAAHAPFKALGRTASTLGAVGALADARKAGTLTRTDSLILDNDATEFAQAAHDAQKAGSKLAHKPEYYFGPETSTNPKAPVTLPGMLARADAGYKKWKPRAQSLEQEKTQWTTVTLPALQKDIQDAKAALALAQATHTGNAAQAAADLKQAQDALAQATVKHTADMQALEAKRADEEARHGKWKGKTKALRTQLAGGQTAWAQEKAKLEADIQAKEAALQTMTAQHGAVSQQALQAEADLQQAQAELLQVKQLESHLKASQDNESRLRAQLDETQRKVSELEEALAKQQSEGSASEVEGLGDLLPTVEGRMSQVPEFKGKDYPSNSVQHVMDYIAYLERKVQQLTPPHVPVVPPHKTAQDDSDAD